MGKRELDTQSKEYKLAYEIAYALNDLDSLDFHISVVMQLHEGVVRKIFNQVIAMPDRRIRTSKAAYYNHLVQRHGWRGYRD